MAKTMILAKISGIEIEIFMKGGEIKARTVVPKRFFQNPSGIIKEDGIFIKYFIKDKKNLPTEAVINTQFLQKGGNKIFIKKTSFEISIILSDEVFKKVDKVIDSGENCYKIDGVGTVIMRYEKYQKRAFFKLTVPLNNSIGNVLKIAKLILILTIRFVKNNKSMFIIY